MKHPGHIQIKPDGVWFEYYELEKPKLYCKCTFCTDLFMRRLKEYEASKRTVKVSNLELYRDNIGLVAMFPKDMRKPGLLEDGQLCIAEITDKAKIIKIT